jgi:hypothetical protein
VAQTCSSCGLPVFRTKFLVTSGSWVGVDCGCARERAVLSVNGSFSDLTLDHIHDSAGKPVRVTSLRQLRQAEKDYNFVHRVANYDGANIDIPEQQRSYSVRDRVMARMGGR